MAFKNILIATDFSEVSQHALLHALAMPKRYDAKLTVVHVAPPEAQSLFLWSQSPSNWTGRKSAARRVWPVLRATRHSICSRTRWC